MPNFWIVPFDANGKRKGNFFIYLGHEADFDPTDGLIALGPLKAEHITFPNTVSATVDGHRVSVSISDFSLDVGDEFRRVGDEGFKELFGETAYETQLAQIDGHDTCLRKLAEWRTPKELELNDLPDIECPQTLDGKVREEVTGYLEKDTSLAAFEAVALIDRHVPGYAADWCAKIKSEHMRSVHLFFLQSLMVIGNRINDQFEGVETEDDLDVFKGVSEQELARARNLHEVAKHFMPLDAQDVADDHFTNIIDHLVSLVSGLSRIIENLEASEIEPPK